MYLTAEEKPDFLVNEVIQKISNSEWTVEVGKNNVTYIEYYLTSGNNIQFMVLKKNLNGIEFRTTYSYNEWEVTFKDHPGQLKLFEERIKMRENHKIENYKDQLKLLEVDLDMANENKKMFYRLWIRWANESRDIESSIHRLNDQIKNTPQ